MNSLFNFIDGTSSDRALKTLKQICPFSLKEKASFVQSDFLDVVASVQAANKAKKKWQETSLGERREILKKLAHLIQTHLHLFATYESEDSGIPLTASSELCAQALKVFLKAIDFNASLELASGSKEVQYQIHSPVGILGIMTDWQQSFAVILKNLAVSLACSNLVILYPSEFGMRSALKLAELAIQAGVHPGVFNVLTGRGEELANHLVEHPGIKYLRFYGNNNLGEKLYLLAAENQKRMATYLGVNNTGVIFSDCDLRSAIQSVLKLGTQFHLYGRNRINRILVQEKILDDFKKEFNLQLAEIKTSLMGPLPNAELKTQFDSYLDQSKKDRAKIYFNLEVNRDSYEAPLTIYEDLTNCSTLHQQDLIGPILFFQSFKYAVDLPKVLNSGVYASTIYVWTKDLVRIQKISQQLDVAKLFFNPKLRSNADLTSTNLKQSGFGKNGLSALFDFNLNSKFVQIGES